MKARRVVVPGLRARVAVALRKYRLLRERGLASCPAPVRGLLLRSASTGFYESAACRRASACAGGSRWQRTSAGSYESAAWRRVPLPCAGCCCARQVLASRRARLAVVSRSRARMAVALGKQLASRRARPEVVLGVGGLRFPLGRNRLLRQRGLPRCPAPVRGLLLRSASTGFPESAAWRRASACAGGRRVRREALAPWRRNDLSRRENLSMFARDSLANDHAFE
jgi:hypothetical protein